jgi:shikimate kinase
MEHKAVLSAIAAEQPAVIIPGGGWAAQPGHMHQARESALLIYLRCMPGTAAKRTEQGEARPVLMGADPVERMRALLGSREPFYKLADFEVAAERGLDQVAAGVVELARQHGGW